ncbi:MAG: alpha/beta hydrolase [Candidatus Promineifilaceae bacterium]|nr:alpha/beta hydrolase [Candidatus Promineifilaceae bacterium]
MVIEEKGRVSGGKLDPQIEYVLAVVAAANEGEGKLLAETAVSEVRSAPDPIDPFSIEKVEVGHVQELSISAEEGHTIPIRVYHPGGADMKSVLVFFHGGCWVFCDLDSHDAICRYLCRQADCIVVSVDYRLAPDHKFPAGVEDAYAATQWVFEHVQELGGDRKRIAVGGDSAGGNLAAVVSLMARDRGEFPLALQLLIYPITNIAEFENESYKAFHTAYFLEQEMMEWAGNHYINNEADRRHPYISPLLAPDLRGLPAAFVLSAEFDILRDEGEVYARRLAEAGNQVRAIRYNGMVHAFVAMAGAVDLGKIALDDCALALKRM